MASLRRWRPLILVVGVWLLGIWYFFGGDDDAFSPMVDPELRKPLIQQEQQPVVDGSVPAYVPGKWRKLSDRYPVTSLRSLPTGKPKANIPKIQKHPAPVESTEARKIRQARLATVRGSFTHSWEGYKKHAWLNDEVTPLTGLPKNPFGGWAATLVDALDTLWIMGMKQEFGIAVDAVDKIDFSTSESQLVNVFETTIRYMGGFLAAYELSGKEYPKLLKKAVEVGELLMCAFDTPNRMPIARWNWKSYSEGDSQKAPHSVLVSELGSLSLEFTKLSQLTGDMKYYDAIQRISDEFEKSQDSTKLPGLFPIIVDASKPSFVGDNAFTLGGMADSLYEYFPKQYLVLGGLLDQPKELYENFIDVAKKHLFWRALNPDDIPMVISGDARVKVMEAGNEVVSSPRGQHLTCFTGGMVGIASRIFNRPEELDLAIQLTDGCVWSYSATQSGIGPEIFGFVACGHIEDSQTGEKCSYTEAKWRTAIRDYWRGGKSSTIKPEGDEITSIIKDRRLPPGFVEFTDKKYILRPEAIESVFIMYRLTGDPTWMDKAWGMFQAVEKHTRSSIGAASLEDITLENPVQVDSMESFWLAETLKYFYLVFSEFDVVHLDEWVLNTEAHPLHRPDVAYG